MSEYDQRDKPEQLASNSEDIQMMKKCIARSLFTHSVPCMLGGLVILKIYNSQGYRTGFWINMATMISSAIAGRISAIPKCLQTTIEKYPDGTVATQFKDRNEIRPRNNGSNTPMVSHPNEQMPAVDQESIARSPVQSSSAQSQQTYDDLRHKNREQYMSRRTAPKAPQAQPEAPLPFVHQMSPASTYSDGPSTISSYSDPPSPYAELTPLIPPSSLSVEDEPKVRRRKRVNIYGDELED